VWKEQRESREDLAIDSKGIDSGGERKEVIGPETYSLIGMTARICGSMVLVWEPGVRTGCYCFFTRGDLGGRGGGFGRGGITGGIAKEMGRRRNT